MFEDFGSGNLERTTAPPICRFARDAVVARPIQTLRSPR